MSNQDILKKYNRDNTITMFGSARDEIGDVYKKETQKLFEKIAELGLNVCFGAGSTGLMGVCARAFKSANPEGKLIGITPEFMNDFEPIYEDCDELIITKDMEERKRLLVSSSKVFIVCPGGQGTLEEWAVTSVSRQLGQIPEDSKIILFNCNGFYSKFVAFLDELARKDFLSRDSHHATIVCNSVDKVVKEVRKLYEISND